jgi:cellulose synthase operon protein YhjQ
MGMPESNSMPKSPSDSNETPEDVATLYSWANLHGAKYRDFSASRAQAREEARLRAEEAQAAERRRHEEEAERQRQEEAQIAARLAAEAAEAARQAEAERLAEIARQAEAERQAVLAAQEAQRQAALQRSWQPQVQETQPGGREDAFEPGFEASFEPAFTVGITPPASFNSPLPGRVDLVQNAPVSSAWRSAAQQPVSAPNQHTGYPQMPASQPGSSQPGSGQPSSSQPSSGQSGQGHFAAAPSLQTPQYPQDEIRDYQAPRYPVPQYPAEPYASSQQESFAPSPWHSAESRDTREPATRPAWLAPEPPVSNAPAAQQAAPGNAYRQPPAAAPSQSFHQPYYTQTPIPMAQQGPGPIYGPGSGQGPAPNQSPGQSSSQSQGIVDDTLAGSRDRIANRWYALKSVFDPQAAPVEQAPAQPPMRVPMLAVFSLAGGVGKTSLVASLGRALSSRGERVLLVDTAAYGLLPFFFGARDQRPGMLRTFNPPGVSAEAPIQLVTLDPENQPQESHQPGSQDSNQHPHLQTNQDWLAQEVGRYARGANRVLVDLPTASGATTRRVLRLGPVVLVPVLPDMNSVVSVGAIEGFFRNSGNIPNASGKPIMPYYLLNQFDYSLPLHLDVREILREQIGDRLLPFALRRSPAVSEALAEGMTVMDYAPNAVVAEDYANLAGWVRGLSAPATQTYRGVRWSER